MTGSAEARARSVAVLAVVLVLGGGLALALPSASSGRSTLETGPEGTAALARVLEGLGHEVESLRLGLHVLPRRPPGSVLFLVGSPRAVSTGLSPADARQIERFAEGGSTVVVVADRQDALLDRLDITYDWRGLSRPPPSSPRGSVEALSVFPHPLSTRPLRVDGRGTLRAERADLIPLATAEGELLALDKPVGKGHVVVVSDPYTVSNAGLSRGGNLEFYVGLVRRRLGPDGRVLFDDLHAGATDAHGVLATARRAGMGPALLVLVLLTGIWLWRASVRVGPVLPSREDRNPRASSEYVEALAGLYDRAGTERHAAAVLSRRFRRAVERRIGGPWDRKVLGARIRRELGDRALRDFDRIARGFGAALADPGPERDALLHLARLVHRFETDHLRRRDRPARPHRSEP